MTYAREATAEPRASAGTNVIAGILAYLQDRRLQPGDRLPSERDLAERLGVGRNAVREALATLVTLRVVESRPNSGVYLRHMSRESSFEALVLLTDIGATPTPTEVTETMEVRAHLELLAVSLACQRRTDEDLARMEAILARTDQTLEAGGNIAEMDTDFHIAVVDAAHNSVLVRTLNAFYRFTARRREVLFADHTQGLASAREHRQMLEHISNRDISKAERLILQHMDRATTYWSSYLEP
ncbi:FadR/GntR family transcriptional regulator [Cupriavidus sp. amp6]|uniref:FadR/GntR family transcriptional regulator n=1 Tax=Cupriavidus sp. amp6 TaxID=388051 RepID=UPI00041DF6FE|nr:FadR/GntR family transcriptional regulator [Cupriavidus sp. amp6]